VSVGSGRRSGNKENVLGFDEAPHLIINGQVNFSHSRSSFRRLGALIPQNTVVHRQPAHLFTPFQIIINYRQERRGAITSGADDSLRNVRREQAHVKETMPP